MISGALSDLRMFREVMDAVAAWRRVGAYRGTAAMCEVPSRRGPLRLGLVGNCAGCVIGNVSRNDFVPLPAPRHRRDHERPVLDS